MNIKGEDQPAHLRSLISAFIIHYMINKLGHIYLTSQLFGELQHGKASDYATNDNLLDQLAMFGMLLYRSTHEPGHVISNNVVF